MVSRDEAEPASRMPRRSGGGTAGLVGSALGGGSGGDLGAGLGAGLRTAGTVRFEALAGRSAARARGALPRARDGFFDGLLEELTPELSDLPDRVRVGFQSYDGRLCRHMRHPFERSVRDALGMNADHPIVNAAFLDH